MKFCSKSANANLALFEVSNKAYFMFSLPKLNVTMLQIMHRDNYSQSLFYDILKILTWRGNQFYQLQTSSSDTLANS